MNIWESILLGIVQGLTEFLPVSSSGHLVLMRDIMGIHGDFLAFDIMLHIGTLMSIVIIMRREILSIFKPPFRTIGLIALASIPAIITGFFLREYIGRVFSTARYLTFFFMLTAIILFLTQMLSKRIGDKGAESINNVRMKTAIYMGLAQGVAIVPGVSRSGSTIAGGIASGAGRRQVAVFSFLMSVPIILGSALVEGITGNIGVNVSAGNIIAGAVASFVSGLLAIKIMLVVIGKANYKWFSLYLVALSIVTFFIYFL